jgi:hypothetical protein
MEAYATQSSYLDVVYTIHWRLNATTGSYFAECYGAQSVAPYNPDSGSFVPYNELTKDIVVGWLTGSMGESTVNNLTASLDMDIERQIKPYTITLPAPWDVPPTPTPTITPTPTPTIDPSITPTPLPPMPTIIPTITPLP